MAGTYVDNYSKRYATNKWVWWTERDAIGIAKYDPAAEKFYTADADQHGKTITLFYYKKAAAFTEPSSVRSMFAGFMSLWTTLRRWMNSSADAIWSVISTDLSRGRWVASPS